MPNNSLFCGVVGYHGYMKARARVTTITCFTLLFGASIAGAQLRERVRPNDNRARAGILNGNTLALRMEARLAEWHPDGEDRPGALIPAFAEIGRQASIPGPLIRVPAGTEVITVVRNAVPNTVLTLHGLHSRPVVGAAFNDSVQLNYAQIQTLRFKLDRPGTYYYWGTTKGTTLPGRAAEDAQLTGVIVVDEAGERQPKDRIMLIGAWTEIPGSELTRSRPRELFVINGRSWPQTDRLIYQRGDTVRWRVINASTDVHPMHLHGFYFRVRRRGDGKADTVYGARGDLANTERMIPGATMYATWIADRVGNWLFHCHIPKHFEQKGPLGYPMQMTVAQQQAATQRSSMTMAMNGLVAGIEIKPAEDDSVVAPTITAAAPNARRLRLLVRPNGGSTPTLPYYGLAVDDRGVEPPEDVGLRVGPPLILTRGEPVSIMLVNRLPEPTSVHWHGIELDSYFDGVPGFSGMRPQLAPIVAPGDSFEVRFTPPRAGTFIYHTHVSETRQQRAGLAGPLIVVDKGRFDPSKDFSVLASSPADSVEEEHAVLINGSAQPAPLLLRRGVPSRLRLINITTARPGMRFELYQDTTFATWRTVAKDGADLPREARSPRPARQPLSIGETVDVEFFPMRPGDYRLETRTTQGALLAVLPIRVQ